MNGNNRPKTPFCRVLSQFDRNRPCRRCFHVFYIALTSAGSPEHPLTDLLGMLLIYPLGLLLIVFHPIGWVYWTGYLCLMFFRRRELLVVPWIASLLMGIKWPKMFWALMGI